MSAYSPRPWVENGHPYYEGDHHRPEAGRGAVRAVYRPPNPPRRFHNDPVPYQACSNGNPGEVWNHYPTEHNHREPSQPLENGFTPVEYSMQMCGEVAPLRRDAMVPGHCGVVNNQDPNLRMGRREMNSRDSQPFSWMRSSEGPRDSPPCGAQHSPHETYGSHHHIAPPLRPHPPYKEGNVRHGECYRPERQLGEQSPMDERRHPIQHDGIMYHNDGPYPTQMRPEYQHPVNRGMMSTPEEKSSPMSVVYQQQRRSYSPSFSPSSWSTVNVGNHQDVGSPRHVGTRMGPTVSPSDSYLPDPQRKPFFHHSTEHRDRVQFERDSRHRDMRMDGSLLVEDHQRMPPRKDGLLPRPWPDERRYPPRCSSEDERYGGVYMPQKNDAVDMMRDPRLNRKTSQHVSHRQDPPPAVHQIVTEHSYCKKRASGSQSEPLSENCEPKSSTLLSCISQSQPRSFSSTVSLKNPIVKVEALPSSRKGNQPFSRTSEESNHSSEGSSTLVKESNNSPVIQQQKHQQEQQQQKQHQEQQQQQQHKQQQEQQQQQQQQQKQQQEQQQQQQKHQEQQQQQKQQEQQQQQKRQQEQQQEDQQQDKTQQQQDTSKETDCKVEHMDVTEQTNDSCVSHSQVGQVLDRDVLQVENDSTPSKGEDSTSAGSHQHSTEVCIEGFELDLDTEPESSDEESEEDADDGCLVVSYQLNDVPDGGVQQPSKWFITPTGTNKIKISKISADVKDELCEQANKPAQIKFPSNRIQLRNGRVLPPSTLAFYASRKGQTSRSNTVTPSSSRESSPEVPMRKVQRVARVLESDEEQEEEQEKVPSCAVEKWSQQEPSSFDGLFGFQDSSPSTPLVSNVPQPMEEEEEEEEAVSMLTKRAKVRPGPRKNTRRRNRRKLKYVVPKKSQKQLSYHPSRTEVSPNSKKKPFQDFEPVVLRTKSRTETQAMLRRQQMEREIEQHELERNQTAHPLSTEGGGDDLEEQDDNSSVCSATLTVSSLSSSRDVDSSTKSSILDEFSPDLIARCKKVIPSRSSGDTPLHKVCRTGRYEMARYMILVESASVNAQDNAGWTPLHEACSSCNSEMAELLLHNGADANISSRDGTRPIHDAIESGCLDLVKVLISHGADPQAEFGEKTPMEYALSIDQMEIYKYLEEVVKERHRLREAQRSKEEQRRLKEKQKSLSPTSQKLANPTITSPTTRVSRKQKLLKQCEDLIATIPVDGYSSSDPSFGEELDFPLFYISPIVELSETPFLPVYNLQVTFEGTNPRRHNFYLLDDILEALTLTESQFWVQCPNIHLHKMTVSEVLKQLHTHYNGQVSLPQRIRQIPRNSRLKFVPLSSQLQELLNIDVANLDD